MTLAEALKTGKLIRRDDAEFTLQYGTVVEEDNGKTKFVYEDAEDGSAVSKPLKLIDILSNDWEVKPEIKEYWVGLFDMHLPNGTQKILRAVAQADRPTSRTADGKPWIKMREVIE